MPLPRVVLFDMDDTIVDFSSSAGPCWKAVCDRFAPECDGVAFERLLAALDAYRAWYWSDPERHRIGRLDMAAQRGFGDIHVGKELQFGRRTVKGHPRPQAGDTLQQAGREMPGQQSQFVIEGGKTPRRRLGRGRSCAPASRCSRDG